MYNLRIQGPRGHSPARLLVVSIVALCFVSIAFAKPPRCASYGESDLDSDGDGLTDREELSVKGLDPRKTDSDNDGFPDSIEILFADKKTIPVVDSATELARLMKKHPVAFLEFSALWCVPSQHFSPVYFRTARLLESDSLAFAVHKASVDVRVAPTKFTLDSGVVAFPTTLLIGPGGSELGQIVGYDYSEAFAAAFAQFARAIDEASKDGRLTYPEARKAWFDAELVELRLNREAFLSVAPPGADDDGDGLSNRRELELGTDPFDDDSDRDGLKDGEETALKTDPLSRDTDGDGVSDGDEIEAGTDPREPNLPPLDSDSDGLSDLLEAGLGTNPFHWDTDRDGTGDGVEHERGTDPLDTASGANRYLLLARNDSDGDGWSDLVEMGVGPNSPSLDAAVDRTGDGVTDLPEALVDMHRGLRAAFGSAWPFDLDAFPGDITDADANGIPDAVEGAGFADDMDGDGRIDLDDELLLLFILMGL